MKKKRNKSKKTRNKENRQAKANKKMKIKQ